MSDMQTNTVSMHLPVTIGHKARRAALLATGQEPDVTQVFHVWDLSDVGPDERERLVDIRERCGFDSGPEYVEPELGHLVEGDDWEVTSLEWVHRDRTNEEITIYLADGAVPGEEPASVMASQILFANEDGRTRNLVEHALEVSSAPDVLEAALAGAPLVSELDEHKLTLDVVLSAYEYALKIVRALVPLVSEGDDAVEASFMWGSINTTKSTIYVRSHLDEGRSVGLHRDSAPDAFDAILPLVSALDQFGAPGADEFRDRVTRHGAGRGWARMTDAERISHWIRPYAEGAQREAEQLAATKKRAEEYEAAAAAWTAEHGSTRLQKAASRGYKHDRLYRDERLAVDLPGFFAAKARKVGEPLAPDEAALDLEAEVEELIAGTSMTCKLAWVVFEDDDDHDEGVHVQVEGFLGRHTVYKRPDDEDDIPY